MKKRYYWIFLAILLLIAVGVFVFLNFNQLYDTYMMYQILNCKENYITQCKVDSDCQCFHCLCLNKNSKICRLSCPANAICDSRGCICVNGKCDRA